MKKKILIAILAALISAGGVIGIVVSTHNGNEDGSSPNQSEYVDGASSGSIDDSSSAHTHNFTLQNLADEYLKTAATCTQKVLYYYSCECGEKGTETFEYGELAEHSLDDDGVCTVCGDSVIEDTKGITYTLSSDKTYYSVTGYTGTATRVRIAESYNNLPVKAIADGAFSNNYEVTEVIIPSSVTSIGGEAFYNCESLTSIPIPDGVISIGDFSFSGCSSLTSVTIPDGVISIGDWAFERCSKLTSVTIGSSVTSIGGSAFYGCNKLVEVINKSKLNITKGDYDHGHVAYYALNVKKEGISEIVNAGDYLFYTVDDTNYLFGYTGNGTDLVLPDKYNGQNYVIYKYAFYGCSSLKSVTIGEGVTSIGDHAFYNCSSLTSVTIPDCVTSIGDWAFYNCSSLTSVIIGEGVTSISYGAFSNCSSLTSVYYKGTETGWNNMSIDNIGNSCLTSATRYYYNESNPFEGENAVTSGNYWHYDTDGKTSVVWTKD